MTARWARLTATALIVVGAAVAVGASAIRLTADWPAVAGEPHKTWLVFGLAIALGSQLQLQLPSGRRFSPVAPAYAVALALAPITTAGTAEVIASSAVLCTTTVATAGGMLLSHARGRSDLTVVAACARVLSVGLISDIYRTLELRDGVTAVDLLTVRHDQQWLAAIIMLTAGSLGAIFEMIADAASSSLPVPYIGRLTQSLADLGVTVVTVPCTAAAIAIGMGPLGPSSIVVMGSPLVLLWVVLRERAIVVRSRRQTIEVLSRLTEVAGYTPRGHGARVSELAGRVGMRLRLDDLELVRLEDAALLHDIGQVSLHEPIPDGATVEAAPADQQEIADEGAAIVRRAKSLEPVADLVQQQAVPFRRMREFAEFIPAESRIIKACNAFDDFTGGRPELRDAALERLSLGLGYEYDPDVVDAVVAVTAPQAQR